MDYSKLTIPSLKALLRGRKASVNGKKKDLIERLICYDRNFNFNTKVPSDILMDVNNNINRLLLPDPAQYKDINASTKLPQIRRANMENYLNRFFVKSKSGQLLYDNKFLLSLRWASDGSVYAIQGTCAAMMKKHVQYVADVLLGDDSVIVGCQCECAAGEGPNAHCKHIVAVMCAMIDLQTEGILNLRKTCTQKLQSFHQPSKEYFGSPVKSEVLPRGSHNRTDKLNFNPTDSASVNSTEYNDRVRKLAINFCSTNISTMPLMHAYMPANLYGVNKDHTYGGDPEDLMLQHLKVRKVSSEDVAAIEEATRQQAGSTLWHEVRTTHLTCSNFYDIIRCVSDRAKVNRAMRLMSPTPFISKYTQHGKDCGPIAIKEYEAMG